MAKVVVIIIIKIFKPKYDLFDVMGAAPISLLAHREVYDWICKTDNLGRTSVPTKVPDQISPVIVERGKSGLNQPETHAACAWKILVISSSCKQCLASLIWDLSNPISVSCANTDVIHIFDTRPRSEIHILIQIP